MRMFFFTTTCLLAGCIVGEVGGGDPSDLGDENVTTVLLTAKPRDGFISVCDLDHRSSDDPIVFPDQAGASHRHSFYGNTTTDAHSTNGNMLPATTSCQFDGDTAAYWMPTAYARNGDVLESMSSRFYYRRGHLSGKIHAYPYGLRMIAGNSMTTVPQSTDIVKWGCAHAEGKVWTQPQDCGSDHVRATVVFPNCWDGQHLDSADHKSHMAYDVNGVCPATHPVQMPHLFLDFQFKTTNGNGVRLSSDMPGMPNGQTLHADFWNTWHEDKLQAKVELCFNSGAACDELK